MVLMLRYDERQLLEAETIGRLRPSQQLLQFRARLECPL